MTILHEQAAALPLRDRRDNNHTRTRALARSQSDAQKGRTAVWTSEARLYGEGHGRPESHGRAS